jgi:hypothetical protein
MFLTVDVLEIDFFVVDVLELDVLGVRPKFSSGTKSNLKDKVRLG